ncbi:MAG: radical SAM/SPASM domain-containing protein [Candidatus Bathyarchaeia archaeon]
MSLTFSVTNSCNSRCKTCNIWQLYPEKPEKKTEELKLWEFEKTFASLGKSIFWATLSGGEPFLRADLSEICEALVETCRPSIVNIPTNSLLPETIEKKTQEILEMCRDVSVIVNLSLDGVGQTHDGIRGVPGNFERFLDTYERLNKLRAKFPSLHLGVHSVVSKFSIGEIFEAYEFAKTLKADSYITEVAEQRTELFTVDKDIAPTAEEYDRFVVEITRRTKRDRFSGKNSLSRFTQAFRLMYYQLAAEELRVRKQVIPCYAGWASGQVSAYGDVWPCCVLGYGHSMGNLRDCDYDFRKVWSSEAAEKIRRSIKAGECACPLANAHYTNILCNPRATLKVLGNILRA